MSGGKVKVMALAGAYAFEGVSYGPFQASKETPFLEVPAALAAALNLPLHPDEVKAREEAQAEQEQDSEGISVDEILKANQDLKADFDRVTGERNGWELEAKRLQSIVDVGKPENEKLMRERADLQVKLADVTRDRDKLAADLAVAQTRITELESQHQATTEAPETPAELAQEQLQEGTPLVEGLPHADLLTTNGFTTMEKLEAGLVVAEGETESSVQKIDGVGKKTLEAYAKAVADWKAGQSN